MNKTINFLTPSRTIQTQTYLTKKNKKALNFQNNNLNKICNNNS